MNKQDFPAAVLAVKKELQENQDPRLETMRLLTETRPEEIYIDDLKSMWHKLSEYSDGLISENAWVHAFLNMAHKFRKLPSYFYMNNPERNEIIDELKNATKTLTRIYTGLDNSTFAQALKSTTEKTIRELEETRLRGKAGKNVEAILFARLMANHHQEMFKDDLRPVIKKAVFAIYGIDYENSDIYNHLYRASL